MLRNWHQKKSTVAFPRSHQMAWGIHRSDLFKFLRAEKYRQVSNTRRTKSQHLKDYRSVLWLSLPNPLKPDFK